MEEIINYQDAMRISERYHFDYYDFLDTFITYERVFDLLNNDSIQCEHSEKNLIEQIETLRPENPVTMFNQYLEYVDDNLKTKITAHNYIVGENALFRKMKQGFPIKLEQYKGRVLKTLCSIYNLLCDLFERIHPSYDKVNKILILEAAPLDLDPIKTRKEAIEIKKIVKRSGKPILPIVRIGTSRHVFEQVLSLSNVKYIHFCGHSCHTNISLMGEKGISTSLSNEKVVEYINNICAPSTTSIRLVYYNSCESSNLAYETFYGIKKVSQSLGNEIEVGDSDAREFATILYEYHFIVKDTPLIAYRKAYSNFAYSGENKAIHAYQTRFYL